MLRLENGKIYNKDNLEVTHLTEKQLDDIIDQLYPNDPVLMNQERFKKTRTSWTGIHYSDISSLESKTNFIDMTDEDTCGMSAKVYRLGGTRLLTLYCNNFNFQLAANELNIKYKTLLKWFHRWREKKLRYGLTIENIFK